MSAPAVLVDLSGNVQAAHRERLVLVYVRQSTPQQVLDHQDSTRLQYGLRRRAEALGWAPERVRVIDDDLGKSGASAVDRTGFQHLVSEVGLGHVGLILGIEMSRLARSCADWYPLLELCALVGTLIADSDGVYDPAQYNDRLLLGLETERAGRHYQALEPENRLVARQLARVWEEKLAAHQQVEEDDARFLQRQPRLLSAAQ